MPGWDRRACTWRWWFPIHCWRRLEFCCSGGENGSRLRSKKTEVRMPIDDPQSAPQSDPRTYLAEERTFLAWIRTGIALMGFGFVVARFGLFLRELSSLKTLPQFQTSVLSVPLGTALLAAGVLVDN